LVSLDGVAPSWMVSVSASVNLPIKSRSFLLALAHPGGPRKRAENDCGKMVVVYSIRRMSESVLLE